mmetsp:Transcript_19688/g.22696  ORF Transcript_19688/g.22696 Transcript_19688/m.22696 type:complete len:109 (+) Transcript_19688:391-717(+)
MPLTLCRSHQLRPNEIVLLAPLPDLQCSNLEECRRRESDARLGTRCANASGLHTRRGRPTLTPWRSSRVPLGNGTSGDECAGFRGTLGTHTGGVRFPCPVGRHYSSIR